MKELISWSEQYSVGINKFDEDHKVIISLINQLHNAMLENKAKEAISKILSVLTSYSATHFEREEMLLKQHNYPNLDVQKKEHAAFIKKIKDFETKYNQGRIITVSIEIVSFLKEWLIKHILAEDKEYSKFLISKGVK